MANIRMNRYGFLALILGAVAAGVIIGLLWNNQTVRAWFKSAWQWLGERVTASRAWMSRKLAPKEKVEQAS